MEVGEKKGSSISSSERAREKWRKSLFYISLVNKWRRLLAGVNTTAATSGYRRFSSPASAANVSTRSDEVAMLHDNQVEKDFPSGLLLARTSTQEGMVGTSTGTSPETQYYSCTDAEQDDDDEGNCKLHRRNSWKRSISMETNNFSSMDVQQSNAGNENCDPRCRRDGSKRKALEWIFAIANFIVELLSIVFDQLSSQSKPVFLPVCLGMSILAVLICVCELVYKIRKEKAIWKRKSVFPWFYHPSGFVLVPLRTLLGWLVLVVNVWSPQLTILCSLSMAILQLRYLFGPASLPSVNCVPKCGVNLISRRMLQAEIIFYGPNIFSLAYDWSLGHKDASPRKSPLVAR